MSPASSLPPSEDSKDSKPAQTAQANPKKLRVKEGCQVIAAGIVYQAGSEVPLDVARNPRHADSLC